MRGGRGWLPNDALETWESFGKSELKVASVAQALKCLDYLDHLKGAQKLPQRCLDHPVVLEFKLESNICKPCTLITPFQGYQVISIFGPTLPPQLLSSRVGDWASGRGQNGRKKFLSYREESNNVILSMGPLETVGLNLCLSIW